jgi:alanyl-tRNA synthetase
LGTEGVSYDPYSTLEVEGPLLAIIKDGQSVQSAQAGERIEVILPATCFYVEAGGQVSDTGVIRAAGEPDWEIRIEDTRRPAAGVIIHAGEVLHGNPGVGDEAIASVDARRRQDIMRNHTATHLLHAELRLVLGAHARQAGSLVAPDRLRFDFTHPEAVTPGQLAQIETGVNRNILDNYHLNIVLKPLQQAISEGATALFGEKYGEIVRTITIGNAEPFSFELCGGTHVGETGDIGVFLITSEGSVGAGLRRIEAVTGRGAYELIQRRFGLLNQTAVLLDASPEQTPTKTQALLDELAETRRQVSALRQEMVSTEFSILLDTVPMVAGIPVLTATLPEADVDTLRQMTDRFRQRYPSGVVVLASVTDGRPSLIAAVTEDLVKRGLHAGELVKAVAQQLGGSGGGRPTLAQAGGKDASQLDSALAGVATWVQGKLTS